MSADLHEHVKRLNYARIVQMCVECLHCSDIGYRHTYTHSAWNAYVTYMTLYLYSYSYYLHILTHICMHIFYIPYRPPILPLLSYSQPLYQRLTSIHKHQFSHHYPKDRLYINKPHPSFLPLLRPLAS